MILSLRKMSSRRPRMNFASQTYFRATSTIRLLGRGSMTPSKSIQVCLSVAQGASGEGEIVLWRLP
jgi:hypothetical protein